mgnify:FL=1
MASRYVFTTKINPTPDDFTPAAAGGTITGASGVAELVFSDTAFTGAEGKTRLILAVEQLLNYLKETKRPWPLT